MYNYLEKVLCIEIIEKISRLQRFLSSEPYDSKRQGAEVVGVFLKAIDGIIDNLNAVIQRLSFKDTATEEEIVLDEWEKQALIRRLSDIFKSIEGLHSCMEFIYGRWVMPETRVFLKNVLDFIPEDRRPEKVNIILSNSYSFAEVDLYEDILSLADIRGNLKGEGQSPSIFLPKIERDNPLNWSILVHECGHVDHQGITNLLETPTIAAAYETPAIKELFSKWFMEIYCDLFATKILGPAYLTSFVTFALLSAGAGGSEVASLTHPADIFRISIIHEVLKNSNLKIVLSDPVLGFDDLSSLFFNMIEERTKLDRKYMHLSVKKPSKLRLGECVDIICEEVDKIISLNQQLTIKDFARVDSLAGRLEKGILIGASPDPDKINSMKKDLEQNITAKKLEEVKGAIQESRVLPWEIVNAGWLYKVKKVYPQSFDIFFSTNELTIEDKIEKWGEDLEGMDRLLLKSIEASEIQALFEEE